MKDQANTEGYHLSALESVTPQMAEQIQQGINQVNTKLFDIIAIQKFKNGNSFVQHVSFNEECTYLLCTCSDRALRLYFFDFQVISKGINKGNKPKNTIKQFQRVIYLKNEIKDVINGRKW